MAFSNISKNTSTASNISKSVSSFLNVGVSTSGAVYTTIGMITGLRGPITYATELLVTAGTVPTFTNLTKN